MFSYRLQRPLARVYVTNYLLWWTLEVCLSPIALYQQSNSKQ
jgi:hypothetical protein